MSVLPQTVTNFATCVHLDRTTRFEDVVFYISYLDQQQVVDLLSYCISVNVHAEHLILDQALFQGVRDACLDELMKRAVDEPF